MIGDPLDLSRSLDVGRREIRFIDLHHEGGGSELDDAREVERVALSRTDQDFSQHPYNIQVYRLPDELTASGEPVLGKNLWVAVEGRPLSAVPASVHPDQAPGHNAHAVAVVVAGHWHDAPLPRFAEDRLVEVCLWLCRGLGLGADAIRGHREVCRNPKYTVCPGYDPERVRQRVRDALR